MISEGHKLYGLVLAGGKSVRMGQDKGNIQWQGVEQKYYMASLLQPLCDAVFISYRESDVNEDNGYAVLTDSYAGIGPYGAILSAFKKYPSAAWLITACDLPLLDTDTLQYLINNRNPDAIATAYESPADGLPEPLIAIWEPKSYGVLLSFLEEGIKCPRKALIRHDNVTLLKATHPEALMNVNTPEEAAIAQQIIEQRRNHTYAG